MGGQGDLVPLVGFGAGRGQHPGVVDKHVQRRHPAGQVRGEGADSAQVGHIAHLHPHVGWMAWGGSRDDLLAARSPLSRSRTVSKTVAPSRARPAAIALPMPRFAPVTSAVRPRSAPGGGSSAQPECRSR